MNSRLYALHDIDRDASDYEEVEISHKGQSMRFERDDTQNWKMTKPYDLPIDKSAVRTMIDKIALIRANEFITHPSLVRQ